MHFDDPAAPAPDSGPWYRGLTRYHWFVLVVAALLVTRAPLGADDLVYERFGDYLEALRLQAGIPALSAVIAGRSDIQWERAYGYQDLDRSIAARTDSGIAPRCTGM